MYQAKREGRNRYIYHRAGLNEEVAHRSALISGLREAVNQDHLLLYYQPQVDVVRGEVIGAEALIRWQHPEWGLVSPAQFIPIAEESGLMGPIGLWVLRRALRDRRVWEQAGHGGLRVAVNVSAQQLSMAGFAAEVGRVLAEEGVGSGSLEIEITESVALGEAEAIRRNLDSLRHFGVGVALDDFGTGYSSLTLLQSLPVDTLKIDRSFVSRLHNDPTTRLIVSSLIQMATGLGISTLAEGVESDDDLAQLDSLGCQQLQGYLLGKPMPADELLRSLEAPDPPWERALRLFRNRLV